VEDTQLVTRATIKDAARNLADAFETDPVWRWLVPSDTTWRRHAAGLFRADVANRLRHGAVYATGGLESIAAWSPPETWEPSLRTLARETPPALRLFGRGLPRALRFLSRMEAAHPKEPHFYLAILGTAPSQQGKGFGHTALVPVLEQCDEQGLPAYLESSKEQNLAFYARHGFVASEPLEVLTDAPPVWPMWREPASA
jgi:GNAT superfamily N-acetyltransferase